MEKLLYESMHLLDTLYDNLDVCLNSEDEEEKELILKRALHYIANLRDKYTPVIDKITEERNEKRRQEQENKIITFHEPMPMAEAWIKEFQVGDTLKIDMHFPATEKHGEIDREFDCVVKTINRFYNPFTFEPAIVPCVYIEKLGETLSISDPENKKLNVRLLKPNEDGTVEEIPITEYTPTVPKPKWTCTLGSCKRVPIEEISKTKIE